MTETAEETQRMTPVRAVSLVDGDFEEATAEELIGAWQYLHGSGLAYTLPGRYGRMAQDLIREGVISA